MANDLPLVRHDLLHAWIAKLYAKAGLPDADAVISSDCTIKTNLWGIDSHGALRTPVYVERILKGAVNPRPDIGFVTAPEGPFSLMDGDAGLGYVVGVRAMTEAVAKAARFGVGMVLVKNSNHFGAASLFARMAAEQGMLGLATTNVMPNLGMPGCKRPVVGNNPLALAAPLDGPFPFSLDISMSSVAGGKILLAQMKGEKIPTTWSLDAEGHETDDPFKAFAGILLPVGMHKGLGLSMFIDIMTGVLGGGPFLQNIKSMYKHGDVPSETSHFFCAMNPGLFQPMETFKARMSTWASMIKSIPMNEPGTTQLIPGELEYGIETKRKAEGLPLPRDLVKELIDLGARLDLGESFPLASS